MNTKGSEAVVAEMREEAEALGHAMMNPNEPQASAIKMSAERDWLTHWADRLSACIAEGEAKSPTEMLSEPGTWKGYSVQIENRTLWVGTDSRGNVLIEATNPSNAQPVQRIAFTKDGGEHLLMLLHCVMGWPVPASAQGAEAVAWIVRDSYGNVIDAHSRKPAPDAYTPGCTFQPVYATPPRAVAVTEPVDRNLYGEMLKVMRELDRLCGVGCDNIATKLVREIMAPANAACEAALAPKEGG